VRRPSFGNVFRLHHNIVRHRTVDGDIRTLEGNDHESFSVQFDAIKKADADAFKAFFIASAGEEIVIRDHEHRSWEGLITSNELRIIKGNNPDCQISFGFDFLGVPVD
jgi:hypothetical protein